MDEQGAGLSDDIDELIRWWFKGTDEERHDRWFSGSPEIDEYVALKWKSTLEQYEQSQHMYDDFTNDELFGSILLFDQVSRHLYRNDLEKIKHCTQHALYLSKLLFSRWETSMNYNIEDEKLVFTLMPFKHTDILQLYPEIDSKIKKYSKSDGTSKLITRFRRDSRKKYYIKQNNDCVSKEKPYNDTYNYQFCMLYGYSIAKFLGCALVTIHIGVLYHQSLLILANVILFYVGWKYRCPRRYGTICEFTGDSEYYTNECVPKEMLYKQLCKKVVKFESITVSLSGGVDSMVLLFLLRKIQLNENHKFELNAVHINYKNRQESDMEQLFVEEYCHYLGVPIFVREIDGLKRKTNDVDREWYEKVTRDIRYNLYKLMQQRHPKKSCIVLGHIRDDCIENVFTNLSKGQHIFNLCKLEENSVMYDVDIWRPAIKVDKSQIYKIAHTHYIPWLNNTTPSWSNRGRLRENFIPAYIDQFGYESFKQLEYISDTLQEYYPLIEDKLKQLVQNTRVNEYGKKILLEKGSGSAHGGIHFWTMALKHYFHSNGMALPSRTAISNFVNGLSRQTSNVLHLRKGVYCYYDVSENTLYLLNAEKFGRKIGIPVRSLGNRHFKEIKKMTWNLSK